MKYDNSNDQTLRLSSRAIESRMISF